jgi:hypothetical protein
MDLTPSFRQGVLTAAAGSLFYALARVIYNVFFHPLARFPGPRGAACTKWWLAYMQLGKGISISTLREELHQKYGTLSTCSFDRSVDPVQGDIIRISPNEVNGVSHLGSRDSQVLTAELPRSSTLQDRRYTMRYTIHRTNGTRIMIITGPSAWTNRSLRKWIILKRSATGRWSQTCFPRVRFRRCSTLFGAKYDLYTPFAHISCLIDFYS